MIIESYIIDFYENPALEQNKCAWFLFCSWGAISVRTIPAPWFAKTKQHFAHIQQNFTKGRMDSVNLY